MSVSKTKKSNPASVVKKPKVSPNAKLRKKPHYKSFRLHKTIKHTAAPLPSWLQLLKKSIALIKVNKKPIAVFFILYGFLSLLLVRGFDSPIDIEGLKETFEDTLGDQQTASIASGFAAFGQLITASTQGSGEVAQLYQNILLIVASLALIWLFRQQQAGNQVTMKMAFYRGMYPFVPFVLILLVIGLQLIPALVGNFLLATVLENSLAVTFVEQFAWMLLACTTVLLSLYMVSSSSIALYIVTLPELTPLVALKKARDLVRYRRMAILLRVIALGFIALIILLVFILPVIFFFPTVAEWLFFSYTVLIIPLAHGYMFSLYRELL